MHKMETRIRYSECAADNKLKIASIINYFQDCTTENSEEIGAGFAYLREKKRAWLLNSWQVLIYRRPVVGEKVEVSTWATGFKGVFGPRDFCMKTTDGEMLACAHSLWVYVDTQTGRPTRPTEEEIAMYEQEEPLPMEPSSRKIVFPETAITVDTFPVRRYQIDTNHHVNNCQYVQMAMEVLPEAYEVKEVRVEYKKAATMGDNLILKKAQEDHKVVAGICDEAGNPYAIVEFIGETKR